MFQPKYLKQAKLLKKGVKKFLHYKEDIIKPDKMEAIQSKLADFEEAVKGREKESIKESAKTLTKACERAVPPAPYPGLRENLEVIFVAIIITLFGLALTGFQNGASSSFRCGSAGSLPITKPPAGAQTSSMGEAPGNATSHGPPSGLAVQPNSSQPDNTNATRNNRFISAPPCKQQTS